MSNDEIIQMTESEIEIEEAYTKIDKILVTTLLDSEIIDIKVALGKLIQQTRAELGTLRADIAYEKNSVSELLQNQKEYVDELMKLKIEKQEQVRKLKEEIKNAYRDDIDCALIPRSDVQDMINKIFTDCAEQSKRQGFSYACGHKTDGMIVM